MGYISASASANGNMAPTRVITGPATGLLNPSGVAVDASGTIYVANSQQNGIDMAPPGNILVFAKDASANAQPSQVISSPLLASPYDLAIY